MKRRGLYSAGVKEAVSSDWASLNQAEKQYEEFRSTCSVSSRRSDLTTPSSMRVYVSSVDSDMPISTAESAFLTETANGLSRQRSGQIMRNRSSTFVKKANRLGLRVKEYQAPPEPSLFQSSRRLVAPDDFEQINDGTLYIHSFFLPCFSHLPRYVLLEEE